MLTHIAADCSFCNVIKHNNVSFVYFYRIMLVAVRFTLWQESQRLLEPRCLVLELVDLIPALKKTSQKDATQHE